MTHFRLLLVMLSLLFMAPQTATAANWEGVFEGTIGEAKVLVELNAGEEKSAYKGGYREGARYSYLPKARDINLILDKEDVLLSFTETLHLHRMFAEAEDKKITGTWLLTVDKEGATGIWTSPKGDKTLPIALKRAPLEKNVDANSNTLSSTYDALWLKTITFVDAGLFKQFGSIEVRKFKDSAFGLEYPLFGNFPDDTRKAATNVILEKDFRSEVVEYRECKNGVPVDWEEEGEGTGPDIVFTVDYATPTVLSFTMTGSVFCGGAHPNTFTTPITYDLTTAEQIGGLAGENKSDLNPEAFGRILKLTNKDDRIAFERFALGRWKEAAAKDKENSENCMAGWSDDEAEGKKDFSLSFAPKGLAITRRDYPSVAAACLFQDFNPTIISWADLKPYLRTDQSLLSSEVK
jgi:hypothetical protein